MNRSIFALLLAVYLSVVGCVGDPEPAVESMAERNANWVTDWKIEVWDPAAADHGGHDFAEYHVWEEARFTIERRRAGGRTANYLVIPERAQSEPDWWPRADWRVDAANKHPEYLKLVQNEEWIKNYICARNSSPKEQSYCLAPKYENTRYQNTLCSDSPGVPCMYTVMTSKHERNGPLSYHILFIDEVEAGCPRTNPETGESERLACLQVDLFCINEDCTQPAMDAAGSLLDVDRVDPELIHKGSGHAHPNI